MSKSGLGFGVWGLVILVALGAAWAQSPAKPEPMAPGVALQNVGAVCQRALEEMAWTGKERKVIGAAFDTLAAVVKIYESEKSEVRSQKEKPADNIGPVGVVPLKDGGAKKN